MRLRILGIVTSILSVGSIAWGGETIDLTAGWRFAPDADQAALEKGWQLPGFDDSSWAVVEGGKRWEDQGFPKLDGYAWYRKRILVPESMRAEHIWLNLGGLDDSGIVYCNGVRAGIFGVQEGVRAGIFGVQEGVTMAKIPIAVDLTASIRWGEENLVAIRVFDWAFSGGLTSGPCTLTADKASLAVHSLLRFVPGFDGRSSIVGLRMGSFGAEKEVRIRFSAALNGKTVVTKEAAAAADYEGAPVGTASLDLPAKPGDKVLVTAETVGNAGSGSGVTLEKTYVWPEPPRWPGKGRGLRALNNFVTELKSVARVGGEKQHYSFLNPREGWVFVRVQGEVEPIANVDGEPGPVVWRKHPETGDHEAMRYLREGEHALRLECAKGARLDIRAVPEIAFCYWPVTSALKASPARDRASAERYILPNMNTLLTHDDMTEEEFASWRAEGRHWLSDANLPGLGDDTAPTADSAYQYWATNACVKRPGYSGIIVDEFLSSPAAHYAAWTEAAERLYKNPEFKDQAFYAWVVGTYAHEPGLKFMRRLYDLGGRFAWERYMHEEPTEDVALLRIYESLGALEEWSALMPGLKGRLSVCLGSFTRPWCSLNINPGVNYLPFMDTQFRVLATDPAFFGLSGVFQWAAHHTDDDALRYAQRLYRHYCIEGKRTPYADYPYMLTHIGNPDFTDGLNDWRVEAAEPHSVAASKYRGLGKIQGRWVLLGWVNVGDNCAIAVRSGLGPNRISQTVKNLESGRLYSMKFIAADMDNLGLKEEAGLWAVLDGADLLPDRSFRCVIPSSHELNLEEFNRKHPAYTTYSQVVFRPKGETVELTFSDWKDGKPAGPIGQRTGFNFVEIQPFFE